MYKEKIKIKRWDFYCTTLWVESTTKKWCWVGRFRSLFFFGFKQRKSQREREREREREGVQSLIIIFPLLLWLYAKREREVSAFSEESLWLLNSCCHRLSCYGPQNIPSSNNNNQVIIMLPSVQLFYYLDFLSEITFNIFKYDFKQQLIFNIFKK